MKKNIIIFSITLITLIIIGYGVLNSVNNKSDKTASSKEPVASLNEVPQNTIKSEPLNLFYSIHTRYNAVKKSDLNRAKYISDLLSEDQMPPLDSYESVSIVLVKDNKRTDIIGLSKDDQLSESQLHLLQSANYATNFLVSANYKDLSEKTIQEKYDYWNPHFSVVPEQQAEYINGEDALISYLEDNGDKTFGPLYEDNRMSTTVYFTVTKQGQITNTRLESNSNYPDIDQKIMKLINNTSGQWNSAKNAKGEHVDQELVISFSAGGC